MSNPMQRSQIEDHIFTLARKVDLQDARWIEGEALAELLAAWRKLARYYEWNHDTTIDAHILKLYMRYAVALRRMIEDERLTPRRRQQARSVLSGLNEHLDGVFRSIERNGGARTAV